MEFDASFMCAGGKIGSIALWCHAALCSSRDSFSHACPEHVETLGSGSGTEDSRGICGGGGGGGGVSISRGGQSADDEFTGTGGGVGLPIGLTDIRSKFTSEDSIFLN